jgi:hypothetical protein
MMGNLALKEWMGLPEDRKQSVALTREDLQGPAQDYLRRKDIAVQGAQRQISDRVDSAGVNLATKLLVEGDAIYDPINQTWKYKDVIQTENKTDPSGRPINQIVWKPASETLSKILSTHAPAIMGRPLEVRDPRHEVQSRGWGQAVKGGSIPQKALASIAEAESELQRELSPAEKYYIAQGHLNAVSDAPSFAELMTETNNRNLLKFIPKREAPITETNIPSRAQGWSFR